MKNKDLSRSKFEQPLLNQYPKNKVHTHGFNGGKNRYHLPVKTTTTNKIP